MSSSVYSRSSTRRGMMMYQNDDASDTQSYASSWRSHLGWMNGSTLPLQPSTDKEQEIASCLNGNFSNDQVDLWKLRQLALSPGGLGSTRKRTWPKLLGADQLLLLKQSNNAKGLKGDSREPSPAEIQQVQKLVRKSHWNIQEHLRVSKLKKKQQRLDELMMQKKTSQTAAGADRQVSFALPSTIQVSADDATVGSMDTSILSIQSTATSATITKLSKQEQQILSNVLVTLLRQSKTSSSSSSSFQPYHGIQSVAAVLLMQLESASLSSLALQQMTSYQLQSFCVGKSDDFGAEYMSLLKLADPSLYRHLQDSEIRETPRCIRDSWLPSWFSQEVASLDVAARLWDVMIVSHPACSLYLAVAITVYFRDEILGSEADFLAVNQVIASLPSRLSGDQSTEDVISHGLGLMEAHPTFMKDPVVSWAVAPTGLSDYALLQAAKARRNKTSTIQEDEEDCNEEAEEEEASSSSYVSMADELTVPPEYRQAAIAAGAIKNQPTSVLSSKYGLLAGAFAVALLVSNSLTSSNGNTSSVNVARANSNVVVDTSTSHSIFHGPRNHSKTTTTVSKEILEAKSTRKPMKPTSPAKVEKTEAVKELSTAKVVKKNPSVAAEIVETQKSDTAVKKEKSPTGRSAIHLKYLPKTDDSTVEADSASGVSQAPTMNQEPTRGERYQEEPTSPPTRNINIALKSMGDASPNQIGLDLVGPWENFRSHWKDVKERRNDKNHRFDGNDILRYSID